MYLLFRILGNDLNGLHGENQTYNNLKFTLENEPEFKNTHKRSIRKESQSLYGLAFFIGNFLGVSEWSTKD